jgi:hypothetical protein
MDKRSAAKKLGAATYAVGAFELNKHVQMAIQQAYSEEIQFVYTGDSLGSAAHP